MHKAGGLISLIAGFFAIAASFFVAAFSLVAPALDSTLDARDGMLYLVGGLFVAGVVIVLSTIILNTRKRTPAIFLVAFSIVAMTFNIGSGFVAICLVFAVLGGSMAAIWRGA